MSDKESLTSAESRLDTAYKHVVIATALFNAAFADLEQIPNACKEREEASAAVVDAMIVHHRAIEELRSEAIKFAYFVCARGFSLAAYSSV